MAVFSKMLTMLRGNLREIGQSVVDSNATTIYEQEIVEATAHVATAKHDLTAVMAKEMQAGREIERLRAELQKYEELAVQALQKNEAGLAEEVAARVADLEVALAEQEEARVQYAGHIARLKDMIRNAEATLREHERQLAMAKTTESVYKATATISQNMGSSGSRLMGAKESLERIRQRHQDLADRMQAAEVLEGEFGTKALENKLAQAGIGERANRKAEVMARLQARVKPAPPDQG
ncbi:phage shock protein A (PspA) family protein [Duganella sp. CF458]|uniref:PspA/IM30 family protein n=1 Tax=Duganella sp. CF458 TaxID=1884368 RepID=UPI0008E84D1C|nr:PspA/IM30 family protein [Duganella sp. CF458]SFG96169.1 phage shock protein A (PspA) family protein [Duganella sp. CF458]